jgi:hypothetical protein
MPQSYRELPHAVIAQIARRAIELHDSGSRRVILNEATTKIVVPANAGTDTPRRSFGLLNEVPTGSCADFRL